MLDDFACTPKVGRSYNCGGRASSILHPRDPPTMANVVADVVQTINGPDGPVASQGFWLLRQHRGPYGRVEHDAVVVPLLRVKKRRHLELRCRDVAACRAAWLQRWSDACHVSKKDAVKFVQ